MAILPKNGYDTSLDGRDLLKFLRTRSLITNIVGKIMMVASMVKMIPIPAIIPNSCIPTVSEIIKVRNAKPVVIPPVIIPGPKRKSVSCIAI